MTLAYLTFNIVDSLADELQLPSAPFRRCAEMVSTALLVCAAITIMEYRADLLTCCCATVSAASRGCGHADVARLGGAPDALPYGHQPLRAGQ
jgi:hypothetical protein